MMTRFTLPSLLPFIFGIALTVCYTDSFAQTIQFCEKIDKNGDCLMGGTLFLLPSKGSTDIHVIARSRNMMAGKTATLDIFISDPSGKEIFENTVKVPVMADWTWYTQAVKFKRPGNYSVFAYDAAGNLIGAGKVTLEVVK